MKLRTTAALIILCTVVLALIGVAGARSGKPKRAGQPPVRVAALDRPFHATRRQRVELLRLMLQVHGAPRASISATASVPDARPVHLPEGLGDAWVTRADDGAFCTFIPDPLGGYGSSCATQEDLRAGGAVTVLGGAGQLNDEAVAVMVVPIGGRDPVVTDPDGSQESTPVDSIGAVVVPEESRVTIGGVSLEIPAFDPHCSSNPNHDFRQCGL